MATFDWYISDIPTEDDLWFEDDHNLSVEFDRADDKWYWIRWDNHNDHALQFAPDGFATAEDAMRAAEIALAVKDGA